MGRVTLDGEAFPSVAATRGWLRFEDVATGSEARLDLGPAGEATYDVTLSPGRYDIVFEGDETHCDDPDWPLPCNAGRVGAVTLEASGVFDVDVPSARVSGNITLNGESLPTDESGRGRVLFDTGVAPPGWVSLGTSEAATYELIVLAGDHDLRYEPAAVGCAESGTMPCVAGPIVMDVALTADGVLDIDIPMAAVSGRITANEATLPDATGSRGALRFELAGGGQVLLPNLASSGEALYGVRLLDGTYDVDWVGEPALCPPGEAPVAIPCNQGPAVHGVNIASDGVLDIDLDVVRVSGVATVNAGPFPLGDRDRTALRFEQQGGGWLGIDDLGDEAAASYDVSLLAGHYDIVFEGLESACPSDDWAMVPCNTGPIVRNAALVADGVLDLDVPLVAISGQVSLNESTDVDPDASPGALSFWVDGGVPFEVPAFATSPAVYQASLLAGEYAVGYVPDATRCQNQSPPDTPCVGGTLDSAVALTVDGVFDVDIPVVLVSGLVTVEGSPPPEGATDRGQLTVVNGEGQHWQSPSVGATGAMDYQARLLPGIFDVAYEPEPTLCTDMVGPGLPCTRQLFDHCEE
jgi:hypothetical protein